MCTLILEALVTRESDRIRALNNQDIVATLALPEWPVHLRVRNYSFCDLLASL
jgi:hypothetical protein